MSQSLLPFILFALVSSISPGPTNLLILAHGARGFAREPGANRCGLWRSGGDRVDGGSGAG